MARLYLATGIEGVARRRPWVMRLVWGVDAAALALFWGAMALLPIDRASAVGARLFRAFGPRTKRSEHVRRNLEIAFPELEADRREALVAEVWAATGRVLAEFPHLGKLRPGGPGSRLELVDNEGVRLVRRRQTPTIFVQAHLANWELGVRAGADLGVPLSVLYKPPQNPFIDRMLRRWRRALGCGFLSKRVSPFVLARELRQGRSIGLLMDQRVDGGEFVSFFGIEAETTLVPALLAVRHGLDLTPVRVERLRGARFRVTFCEPIRPDPGAGDTREQALDMTRGLFALFEDWIRERPEQWMCSKRRWPEPGRSRAPAAATRSKPSLAHS